MQLTDSGLSKLERKYTILSWTVQYFYIALKVMFYLLIIKH